MALVPAIVVQLLLKYGQAARGANVVSIVPGFASMYRTSALAEIEVLAPGLVIEDFNMTFEIHAKKLFLADSQTARPAVQRILVCPGAVHRLSLIYCGYRIL